MALRTLLVTILVLLNHHYHFASSESAPLDDESSHLPPPPSSHRAFDNQNDTFSELPEYPLNSDRVGRTFFGDIGGFLRPSIFNIVRFPNEECLDASNQSGTCYTALECKKLGGNPSSKCARGLGTCCIMSRTCHNSTANKVVYFRNPSYPLTDSIQNFCDLTVNIVDPDICQLRIDFLEFQIDGPVNGDCVGDKFTVTASGMTPTSVPVLCGNNRNQHIYVTLPAQTNTADRSVSIVFETNSAGDYRWHLKVTQLDCRIRQPSNGSSSSTSSTSSSSSSSAASILNGAPVVAPIGRRRKRSLYQKIPNQITLPAPTGCLQYYTAPTGTIESFNFGSYLNNLDYAICIERQPDTCRVLFTSSDANFGVKGGGNVIGVMSGVGDQDCPDDYLLLAGGSGNGEGQTKDRYCGGILSYTSGGSTPQTVISKANGPLVIRFHSDATAAQDLKEGFRVKYEQSPTDCAVLNSGTINPANLININQAPPIVVALHSGDKSKVPIPSPVGTSAVASSASQMSDGNEMRTAEPGTIKSRSNAKMLNV